MAVISTGGVGSNAVRELSPSGRSGARRRLGAQPGQGGHGRGHAGSGTDVIGLAATGDLDEIVTLAPDCAIYAASGPDLDATAVADYVRLLNAGINVVTTTSPGLVCPHAWIADFERQVRAAASAGGATIYASGLEPGFAADHLVVLLSILLVEHHRIGSDTGDLRLLELSQHVHDVRRVRLRRPLDYTPIMSMGGTQKFALGTLVELVADALHVTLEDVVDTYDRAFIRAKPRVAAGHPAGTCGAIRMETIGIVNGKPAIVIEHVNRMARRSGPPTGRLAAARDGTYRIHNRRRSRTWSCELTPGQEKISAQCGRHDGHHHAGRLTPSPTSWAAPPGIATLLWNSPITATSPTPRDRRLRGANWSSMMPSQTWVASTRPSR